MSEVRFTRIADGVIAQVVERAGIDPVTKKPRSVLPQRLEALLSAMVITSDTGARIYGARRACTNAEHDFTPWRRGIYAGLELKLGLCQFCGVVEVRDASLDLLPGVRTGAAGPRRRDDVLGWYSGQREAHRTYL